MKLFSMVLLVAMVVTGVRAKDANFIGAGPVKKTTARGYTEPVTVQYGFYELDRDYIFLFTGDVEEIVIRAQTSGWAAKSWSLGPGRKLEDLRDDEIPPYIPGVPWRPAGTMVVLSARQWRTLQGADDTARLKTALEVLAPEPAEWYIDIGPSWPEKVATKR